MKILYIDAFSGVSGDKMVAALLSLTEGQALLNKALSTLPITDEFQIEVLEKKVMAINSLKFNVHITGKEDHHDHTHESVHPDDHDHTHDHPHHHEHQEEPGLKTHTHRNLNDIIAMINQSGLTEQAKKMAIDIFKIIGQSEAKIHKQKLEEVHFHEVGAVDSIVDIVSTAVLIDSLGIDAVYASSIPLGSGFVKADHGLLPVPAPATLDILQGIPVYSSDINTELTTPTGAGILKCLVNQYGAIPEMQINKIGYGAGSKNLSIPNVLRLLMGELKSSNTEETDSVLCLETNLDDCTAEQMGFLMEMLLEKGALDVFFTPIFMKKNRPAQMVTVLCHEKLHQVMEEILFKNSTSFGIRRTLLKRSILKREKTTVMIDGQQIDLKLGFRSGIKIQTSIEYESLKKAAHNLKLSYNEMRQKINKTLGEQNLLD